jgi:hypothetical protein
MKNELQITISRPMTVHAAHYEPGSKAGYLDVGFRVYCTAIGHTLDAFEEAFTNDRPVLLVPEHLDNGDVSFIAHFREWQDDSEKGEW